MTHPERKTGLLKHYRWDGIKKRYAPLIISGVLNHLKNIYSVYDFGCGTGVYVNEFLRQGIDCIGFELSDHAFYAPQVDFDYMHQQDICGKGLIGLMPVDLVFCVEVAEHIPPDRTDAFINNLTKLSRGYIFLTSSNKTGRYHLNPQPQSYWIDRVTAYDRFQYLPDVSETLMQEYKTGINKQTLLWFQNDLMIFRAVD